MCALQSGTSADGIDVLVVEAEPEGDALVLRTVDWRTVPWQPELRRSILDVTHGASIDAAAWCALDWRLGEAFADTVRDIPDLDLVVSHGQTVYHWVEDGHARGTTQLGEPAPIAEAAGCPVLSHLRSADIAAGGEGAPLMALFDRLWLGPIAEASGEGIATVNIGGIANVQVVHPDGRVQAWDSGPGNALLDALVERRTGGEQGFDRDGALAAAGTVRPELMRALRAHPYFALPAPKSTGRHEFHLGLLDDAARSEAAEPLSDADAAATLVELTAWSIAEALRASGATSAIISGGGVRNPVLMRRLAELAAPVRISSSAEHGVDPDSRENLMFAVLGVLSWHGIPISLTTTGSRIAGRFTAAHAPLGLPRPRPAFARVEVRR
ncbi:anhydro-N-acetylmuramic acid kinase [Microbacterium sp. NPDC057659]|uniref:anhydro-N-acetylmuramic acid kinase n=1 Tax=Microbacterium sp. NPDC057659 TaxID=3346198 RepID=UPI003671AF54